MQRDSNLFRANFSYFSDSSWNIKMYLNFLDSALDNFDKKKYIFKNKSYFKILAESKDSFLYGERKFSKNEPKEELVYKIFKKKYWSLQKKKNTKLNFEQFVLFLKNLNHLDKTLDLPISKYLKSKNIYYHRSFTVYSNK